MTSIALEKPISKAQKIIAQKCGWRNANNIQVRKNIIPEGFVGTATQIDEPIAIRTKLNKENFEVLEEILENNKLFNSKFVKSNLTEILKMGNTYKDKKILKEILIPENIDKIETQRRLVKNNPRLYIKDKDIVKYITSPAGLNSVFSNINILKAAAVFDAKTLDNLFKMDITTGKGELLLNTLGTINNKEFNFIKKVSQYNNSEQALEYLKQKTNITN